MRCGLTWVAALVACAGEPAVEVSQVAAPVELLMDGRIVPREATELRAPQNSFQVGDWRSWGGWVKLVELVDDGNEVEEGDVVARFSFDYENAQSYVNRKIASAEADKERSSLDQEARHRQLSMELSQRDLDVQRAGLSLLQAGVIAQRTLAAYEIDHRLTEFESEAIRKRIGAQESAMAAEARYHELATARAQAMQVRYDSNKKRFQVIAPHAGVVRHAYHRRRGRKVQKGDGMPAGHPIVSIARGSDLSARIFVPEHLVGRLKVGNQIEVLGLDDEEHDAVVRKIDPVPQEMSFLRRDDNIPNAREKAFNVEADFVGDAELTAGNDVKVRLP